MRTRLSNATGRLLRSKPNLSLQGRCVHSIPASIAPKPLERSSVLFARMKSSASSIRILAGSYRKAIDNQVDKSWLAAQEKQFVAERNNCGMRPPPEIRPCVQQLVGTRAMYLSTLWKKDLPAAAPAPISAPAIKPIDAAVAAQSASRNGIVSANYDDSLKKPVVQTDPHISPFWILVLLGLFLYFLPSIIAANRGHHNALAIFALNLFLGWSFLGWVLAFVWACTRVEARGLAPQVDVLTARREPQI